MFDDLIPEQSHAENDPFADLIPKKPESGNSASAAADDIGLKLNIGTTVAIPEQVAGLGRILQKTNPMLMALDAVTPQSLLDLRAEKENQADAWMRDRRTKLTAELSPEQQAADQKQYFTDEASWSNLAKNGISAVPGKVAELATDGKLFDSGWKDWRKVTGSVAESAPSTLLTMGPTAKAAGAAGTAAFDTALARTGSEVAASAAAKKAAERTAMVAGGAAEGLQGAGGAYTQTRREVMDMPIEKLQSSPYFQEQLAANGGDFAAARASAADAAAMTSAGVAFLFDSTLGALGDRYLGTAAAGSGTRAGAVVRGTLQEAPTELLQSGGEKFGENLGIQRFADPSQGLLEGVGEDAAGGMLSGGAMGGAMGGAFHRSAGPARLPDTGPMSRAANKAMDSGAVNAGDVLGVPAQEQSPVGGLSGAVTDSMQPVDAGAQALANVQRQPASLSGPDRVREIETRLAELQTADPASPEVAALAGERDQITAGWPQAVIGAQTSFSTESGARLDARYALMDASQLVTSHDEQLRPSPSYPKELQPRERDRAASEMQISGIAQRLDPARLGESADSATGAPIVGADGLVESGNARSIAIKRAYSGIPENAAAYRQFLQDNAQRFGLDPQAVSGMQNPVLVRVRETPVDRVEFARQANASTVAQMSPSEQARADAGRLDTLDDLHPTEDGDFMSSRDFIRRFVGRLPGTEQAGMMDANGQLSQAGYTRVRNAILAKAYGDSPVLTRMVESLDDNLRNVGKALMRAAPEVAKMRADITDGALFEADITPDLLAGVETLSRLKDEGRSISDVLSQADMLGGGLSPEAGQLLAFMDENIRKPRRIAEFIQRYTEALRAAGNPNQGSLLGETQAPSKRDIINAAWNQANESAGQIGQQQSGQPQGNPGSGQKAGEQRGIAQGGSDGAQGGDAVARPETALSFARAEVENSRGQKVPGFVAEFDNNKGGKGYIELSEDGGRLYPSMVDNGLFKPGESTGGAVSNVYEQAIEFAARQGKQFTSDDSVTVAAARIYEGLARRGHQVVKNPSARLATPPEVVTDRWVTDDGTPVFSVDESPRFSRAAGTEPESERQFKETERAYGGREAYDRAKAAGKTKLNYRQWVQVRTPAFKAWFGDWEIASSAPKRQASTFDEARVAAKAFQGKPLENTMTGMKAVVSRNNLDKMLNSKAVSKSESAQAHAFAVANLDDLFSRSLIGWSKPDADGDPNIKAIHRFFAPVMVDGRAILAKMTVKETAIENDPNPLYTVESVEFNEKSPAAQWVAAASSADGVDLTSIRSAGDVLTLAQRVQEFNPDTVSKVTDQETGEPLVVYHGTNADFSAFEKEYQRAGQYGGEGFFFTPSPEAAGLFGDTIMPVFLRANTGLLEKRRARAEGREVSVDHIRPQNDQRDIWVVFDPEQIKSATGNNGDFDGANPDIRFSRSGKSLEAVKTAWRESGIDFALMEKGDVVTISKIVVPEGGRDAGIGTRAMEQLIAWADANGKHIALTPSADFGGNKSRLTQFYKRFGFKENKGKNRVFSVSESMVRENPNGKTLYSFAGQRSQTADQYAPANASRPRPMTREDIASAVSAQFPSLAKAIQSALRLGDAGKKGGVVVVEQAADLAGVFASKTGRSMDQSVKLLGSSENGDIQGFFDPKSGLTFLSGSALTAETAPAVLLHEATHGKQRAVIDAQALALLESRSSLHKPVRDFLDKVAGRMDKAGVAGKAAEASAYIVEEAVLDGRRAGFSAVDGKLLTWIDNMLGKRVGDIVRGFVAQVRAWILRANLGISPSIDDMVALAKLNVQDMARGDVAGRAGMSRAESVAESFPRVGSDEFLTLFDSADSINIEAPVMTEQEIDDVEARFLSDAPAGTRYPRSTRLLKRVRRESDRAAGELGGAAETPRRNDRPLGGFSGYEIRADQLEADSFNPDGSLQIIVYGYEQLDAGLTDEPALTITVTPDGELTINGPAPGTETFKEFQKRGWADLAKGANGEVQPGWSALKDPANPDGTLPITQVLPLLADIHARVRAWREEDYVGLHWSRATGAMGGLPGMETGQATAVFFSRSNIRASSATGMAVRDLSAVVARVSKHLKNLPRVHVLESPAGLSTKDPAQMALRDFIRRAGAWEDVEGATHEGEIYLFASGLADEARAEHVLAVHEVTHYGLRGAVGEKRLDAALQEVWAANASVRKAAAALRERFGLESNVEATEEVLADMRPGELVKLVGWRRIVKVVRDWLSRSGFERLAARFDAWMKAGMTDQEKADVMVADLVTAAREWVRNGKGRPFMGGTRLADGSLADDLAEQEKWLTREAKARGFKTIDELAEKNYQAFENLAKLWREKHQVDGALLSRKDGRANLSRSSQTANQPATAAQRADEIISKPVANWKPVDTIMRTLTTTVRLDRLTSAIYDRAAQIIDRYTPENVKAGVVADYGIPEAVIDQRTMMQGRMRVQLRKTGELIDRLGTLTRAESRIAYEWMNNADPQAAAYFEAQLPPESLKVMEEVKGMIDALSQEAVALGQLDPDAFKRNRFEYLRRSYIKHTTELTKAETRSRKRSIAIMGEQYKGRGMSDAVDMAKFKNVAPEWWGRKLKEGQADKGLKGEKFIRLERRAPTGEGVMELAPAAGPGNTNPQPKGRLMEVIYWPAGEAIPAKYSSWDQAGTWEVRDTKGGKLIVWRDFTKQERVAMGEIDEARYAMAKTLHGMIHDVETGRYLEWVGQTYGKKAGDAIDGDLVEASDRMRDVFKPGEWVQVPETKIPGTNVLKYGKLAGRIIPGPIWNDVRQTVGFKFKPLGETYAAILGAWKTAKTALSPAVHTNNIMANMVMADWHDVGSGHVLKALRIILGASQRQGKGAIGRAGNALSRAGIVDAEAAREILQRYGDSGANLGSWVTAELQREQLEPLLESLEKEIGIAGQTVAGEVGVMAALQKALQLRFPSAWDAFKPTVAGRAITTEARSMIDLYEAEDQVFRLAAWLKAKEDGASDLAAGKVARRSFLDYNINAPWVQALRNTAFPFISFTYRAVPMLLETAARRPHKLMKLGLVAGALNALGYMLSGGDEDDERKLLPEEKAGSIFGMVPKLIRMPWNDAHGAPVFLDIRRFVPVGDIFDLGATHAAIPLLPFTVPGGPLALLSELVANKSQFTGREITQETDTAVEKAFNVADHLFKAFAPNLLLPGPGTALRSIGVPLKNGQLDTHAWTGVVNAGTGKTDSFGREQSTIQAAASAFGVKLGSYPKDVLHLNAERATMAKLMEIDRNITRLKRERQRNGINEAEFVSEYQAQMAKKRTVIEEFQERVK